jgi:hypothetical protein
MGILKRNRLRIWLLLAGFGATGLVIAFLAASSPAHPVTLSFLRSTNEVGREVIAWEINNRLPREVWWRIQTGGTNYPGSLTLQSNDGMSYQSGVWHGIGQYSGEPPVQAHGSWRPMSKHPDVRGKRGDRIWLVWSDQPKSKPAPRSALDNWRWSFSYFLERNGWKLGGAMVRPKSNEPHVEEMVVP